MCYSTGSERNFLSGTKTEKKNIDWNFNLSLLCLKLNKNVLDIHKL